MQKIPNISSMDYLAIFMAIILQIHINLFANGDYLGIRIGLADLFMPIIGIMVLISLIKNKSKWPQWSINKMYLWLAALIFVMSVSLLNGYLTNGYLSKWAFINKYIGLFLLVSYMMLGGWIVTNAKDSLKILTLFSNVFTGFFSLTVLMSVITLFLQYFIPYPLWLPNYPWDGLMVNRNAFMVIFVLSLTLIICSYKDDKSTMHQLVIKVFWLCLPIFLVFNDSRTGWLAFTALIIVFFTKFPIKRARKIIPLLLIGTIIAYASYYVTTNTIVLQARQMKHLIKIIDNKGNSDLEYFGDQKRYVAVEDGMELYQEHNPIIGSGLGTYKPFQINKRGEFIDVIDFSGLWLLVETGILGLSIFSAFFIICAWSLYKTGFTKNHSGFHKAIFVFLIMFAFMAILHELIYTRVLWFIVGLALAFNIKEKDTNNV